MEKGFVYDVYKSITDNMHVIPLLKINILDNGEYVIEPTTDGYLMNCDNEYTLTFQMKFFQDCYGKSKFNEKDAEYIDYIYETIEDITYNLWCYNLYFEQFDQRSNNLMTTRCPSLLNKIKAFVNLKYHKLPRIIGKLKIEGPKTKEEMVIRYLYDIGLISEYHNIVPMSDPYCKVAFNIGSHIDQIRSFLTVTSMTRSQIKILHKNLACLLLPFLIPQNMALSFRYLNNENQALLYTLSDFVAFYNHIDPNLETSIPPKVINNVQLDYMSDQDIKHLFDPQNKFTDPLNLMKLDLLLVRLEKNGTSIEKYPKRVWGTYNFRTLRGNKQNDFKHLNSNMTKSILINESNEFLRVENKI